ncbi:con-Ins K1-like [Nematostella vectensis]|uniref:con-Ins K1-like n=1 Tax=Nematostella vectensis TaxID=45351 RepID=UPI002077898E|nr:con-Ins K1-like [Nematostella vectensis]
MVCSRVCLGCCVLIVLTLVCCVYGTCVGQCKVSESSSASVDYKLCGDQIISVWQQLCYQGSQQLGMLKSEVRRKRQVTQDKEYAKSFLRVRRSGSSTDINEECCVEGCAQEEINEYC